MSSEVVIRVHKICKNYHIYDKPQDRLKQSLWCGKKQFYRNFRALNNISFEIKKGETVGIIGRNGSGKSTLLQIICGTLAPTSGTVEVKGRVAALLELGTGFNPDFTGKENVYMNASILGLSSKEIDDKYNEIISFSEIEEFIDQPVHTYSSGMMVRLAFAVQISIEPDILIVDEALSVGDFFFQQKCFAKIKELQNRGTTLLFVSHDTGVVRDLCRKGVYLQHGEMIFWGDNLVAIRKYLAEDKVVGLESNTLNDRISQNTPSSIDSEILLDDALWRNTNRPEHSSLKAMILAVGVYDVQGKAVTAVEMGSEIIIRVMYQVFVDEVVDVNIIFKNKYDQIITSTGSYPLGIVHLQPRGCFVFEIRLEMMLESGYYGLNISLGCVINNSNSGELIAETSWLGPIHIMWSYDSCTPKFYGMVGLKAEGFFKELTHV